MSATKTGYRIFVKFGIGFRYKKLCVEPEFRENRLTNIRFLLRNVCEFLPVNFRVYLRTLTRFDNKRFSCYASEKFENFVRNRCGETGYVSKGVNRILSVCFIHYLLELCAFRHKRFSLDCTEFLPLFYTFNP